jgi:regulator of replication initiation timing
MNNEYDIEVPDWAKKVKIWIAKLTNENVMLSLEVDRLNSNIEDMEETDNKFEEWIEEFLTQEGGKPLVNKYKKYIDKKMDEGDD